MKIRSTIEAEQVVRVGGGSAPATSRFRASGLGRPCFRRPYSRLALSKDSTGCCIRVGPLPQPSPTESGRLSGTPRCAFTPAPQAGDVAQLESRCPSFRASARLSAVLSDASSAWTPCARCPAAGDPATRRPPPCTSTLPGHRADVRVPPRGSPAAWLLASSANHPAPASVARSPRLAAAGHSTGRSGAECSCTRVGRQLVLRALTAALRATRAPSI